MIEPAGPGAALIESFWWVVVAALGCVYVVVMAAVALACRKGRRPEPAPPSDASLRRGVASATVLTVLFLFAYLVGDLQVARALGHERVADAMTIEVTAHQWWWEVEYPATPPSRRVRTANEIHIPVGRPTRIVLTSADVIHSLWVPSLQGKRDVIPGRETELWIEADEPGELGGRCAEFCGHQHAKMALRIIADPPRVFRTWYEGQLRPAAAPAGPLAARGLDVLLHKPCVTCHTVRGTLAGGRNGPDLTHLTSRGTLAAGVFPNTRGYLAGWILDPQTMKPGAHMPATSLTPDELMGLLAYLEELR